jgi:excisionase family DNA binding protein
MANKRSKVNKKMDKLGKTELPQYYKISDVAKALNVSVPKIKELINNGEITVVKLGEKTYRISKVEFDKLTKAGKLFEEY